MIEIPCDALREALNGDAEFRHAARYWDTSLRLGFETETIWLRIRDGVVDEIRSWTLLDSSELAISGPESGWQKLLAPIPPPFYQSLFAATVHHGFTMTGNLETAYAYMAALSRMIDVLRVHVHVKSSANAA